MPPLAGLPIRGIGSGIIRVDPPQPCLYGHVTRHSRRDRPTLEHREPGRKPAGAFSGPRLRQYRVHHGRKIATAPLLFVNYVFVAIVDHWWTASRTPGLRSGCSAGSNRFALTNRRLQDIRSDSLVALSVADANSTPSDP
jgi:hypothetical protein